MQNKKPPPSSIPPEIVKIPGAEPSAKIDAWWGLVLAVIVIVILILIFVPDPYARMVRFMLDMSSSSWASNPAETRRISGEKTSSSGKRWRSIISRYFRSPCPGSTGLFMVVPRPSSFPTSNSRPVPGKENEGCSWME